MPITSSSNSGAVAALTGWSDSNQQLLNVAVSGGQFQFTGGGADDAKIVRLDFSDPQGGRLFVLPVIPGTFSSQFDRQQITLQGWMRCFAPEDGGSFDPVSSVPFKLKIEPAAAAGALIQFRAVSIMDIDASTMPLACTRDALPSMRLMAQETLRGNHGYELIGFPKSVAGLWMWSVRFVPLPVRPDQKAHAALALEIITQFPVTDSQTLHPLSLSLPGNLFPQNGGLRFTVILQRLPREDQWGDTGLTRQWWVSFGVPQALVLQWWNSTVVQPVISSAKTIRDGQPLTVLPELDADSTPAATHLWFFYFTFFDNSQQKNVKDNFSSLAISSKPDTAGQVYVIPRSLEPRPEYLMLLQASFPLVLGHQGMLQSPFWAGAPLDYKELWAQSSAVSDAPQIRFSFEQPGTTPGTPTMFRFGSLDLAIAAPSSPTPDWQSNEGTAVEGALTCAVSIAADGNSFTYGSIVFRQAKFQVNVTASQPGSQDDAPGDTTVSSVSASDYNQTVEFTKLLARSRPLVIPLAAPPQQPQFLKLAEIIQPGDSQSIWVELHQKQAADQPTPINALVLDSSPFNVALVSSSLANADVDQTTAIGSWSNRTGDPAWQIAAQTAGFNLFLPPQGMGESMHRRAEDQDIVPGERIDFRHSPAALLTLQPGDLQKRFTEVPWNLRRLLNQTAFLAGLPLDSAFFESFYALSGTFSVPGLRLSELAARRGSNSEPLGSTLPWTPTAQQESTFDTYSAQFNFILRAVRTRLAIFEVWNPADSLTAGGTVENPLTITDADSLQFRQRRSARLRYPIPDQKPRLVDADEFQDANGNLIPDGLAGGWAWGFESQNILEAVRKSRDSYSASLTGLFFSALGGWADQKATFDNGLSLIHAKVEMGRASTINIERIGRIGVFWNRAKHVIVYERTVCASRQFYQEQYPLTGNPVLRKVQEYIELLEEERAFPDKSVSPLSRGFVMGLRFTGGKPPRIPVNSKWGQDVGTTGWRIPLWQRGASPRDVYPKPTVFVLTAGTAPNEVVPIAVSDPEKLCFYTQTGDSSNPDDWTQVEGVDYQTVPADSFQTPSLDGVKSESDPRVTAPVPFIPPGASSFTFSLEPAPGPSNLVVDRANQAVGAMPRALTLMRGYKVAATKPAGDVLYNAQALRDQLSAVVAPLLHSDAPAADALKSAKDALGNLTDQINQFDVSKLGGKICEALANRLDSQAQIFENDIRLGIVSALHQLDASFDASLQDAFAAAAGDAGRLKTLLHQSLDALIEGESGVRNVILRARGSLDELRANLDALPDTLQSFAWQLGLILDQARTAIQDVQDGGGFAAAAGQILKQATDRWQPILLGGGCTFPVREAMRAWLGPQIDVLSHALSGYSAALFQGLTSIVITTKQALLDALANLAGSLAGTLAPQDLIDLVNGLLDRIDTVLDAGGSGLDQPLDDLAGSIGKQIDAIDASTTLDEFRTRLSGEVNGYLSAVDGRLTTVLDSARAIAKTQVAQLCTNLLPDPKALLDDLKKLFPGGLDFLNGIGALTPDLRARVDDLLHQWTPAIDGFIHRIQLHVPQITWPKIDTSNFDNTLRLFRAFGDVPHLPSLDFSRLQLAYQFPFQNFQPHIDLSPVFTFANKLGASTLGGFDLRLPTIQLVDRFVPPDLGSFDLSNLLPSIAGLKLSSLFNGFTTPPGAGDAIKVTHGIDQATRSGWMQADIDFATAKPANIFNLAGISLTLNSGRIRATSRVDGAVGGPAPRQRTSGSIEGDWFIQAGSFAVVNITSSVLSFDAEGKIHFQVTPAQVVLQPPLDFISRLLEPFQTDKDGFKVSVTATGVRSSLVLPLPNIQAGSFGIANLTLGFLFEVLILPKFTIRTALQLARPDRPFTLTIFILGGAGSVQLAVAYTPDNGEFLTTLTVSLYASASLAVSLGPVSGGVYVYAGVEVNFTASNRGANSFSFTLRILFVGEVSLLGFISVGMSLSLEAEYQSGNNLIGRGSVSFHIKIGWFLSINVDASVEYSFGSGQSSSQSSTQVSGAAADYAQMF